MSAKPIPKITELNRLYFEGTAAGELRIRTCESCGHRFRFAYRWCPACWSLDLGWEKASGRGRVSHFSVVHQAPYPAWDGDTPYVLALVELEEGVRMMTNIVGCDPTTVAIGMAVTVDYERRGEVALPIFRPLKRA